MSKLTKKVVKSALPELFVGKDVVIDGKRVALTSVTFSDSKGDNGVRISACVYAHIVETAEAAEAAEAVETVETVEAVEAVSYMAKISNIDIELALWGKIKGHITSRGYKKNSLWIVDAMTEKHARETTVHVKQLHNYQCQVRTALSTWDGIVCAETSEQAKRTAINIAELTYAMPRTDIIETTARHLSHKETVWMQL